MYKLKNMILMRRICADTGGQDLVECALMAGFVAVVAGAIMPDIATSISSIFSSISTILSWASTQG